MTKPRMTNDESTRITQCSNRGRPSTCQQRAATIRAATVRERLLARLLARASAPGKTAPLRSRLVRLRTFEHSCLIRYSSFDFRVFRKDPMAAQPNIPGVDPQVQQQCEEFRRDYRAVQAEIAK